MPGGTFSGAYGLGDSGVVVGFSETRDGHRHAARWSPAGWGGDLGTLYGNTFAPGRGGACGFGQSLH